MKAMTNRSTSGISAPNTLSNIAPPPRPLGGAAILGQQTGIAEWLTPVGNTCRREY
jgi:hypothetical protein